MEVFIEKLSMLYFKEVVKDMLFLKIMVKKKYDVNCYVYLVVFFFYFQCFVFFYFILVIMIDFKKLFVLYVKQGYLMFLYDKYLKMFLKFKEFFVFCFVQRFICIEVYMYLMNLVILKCIFFLFRKNYL